MREEVECPVCCEEMIPPKQIFQVFPCLFVWLNRIQIFHIFVFVVCSDRIFCWFVCSFVQMGYNPGHVCLYAHLFKKNFGF